MDALQDKYLRHAYVALLFGDGGLKHWTDEGLKELAKESAAMMLSNNWKSYYKTIKKKRKLGKPEYDSEGIWYDTPLGVALRVDFRKNWTGQLYVDG